MAKNTTEAEASDADKLARDRGETPGAKGHKEPVPVHVGGDSLLDRITPHIKKIAIGGVVITVVLMAVFGYRWWRNRGRAKDTTAVAAALELGQREVVAPATPDPANPDPIPTPAADPATFPSQQARAAAILAQLDKGGATNVGAVYRAGLLLDAGRLDDAEAAYASARTATGLDGVLAREGLGFVHEARAHAATDAVARQQHLEAALAAFRAAQVDDTGPRRDHALYHQARILAMLDHKADAVAALEKALVIAPETELASVINDRLAQLEAQ